jgi:uncharacterized protein
MPSPAIEKLLVLQDRDARRLGIEAQLKSMPREIALTEQKIAAEKASIEVARLEVRELEAKKKLMETEIGSAEDKLAKYKNQQMQVRKNDEFQALGHEIATTQAAIEVIEGQELEVMYAIDSAKKKFTAAEVALKQNIVGHETRIRTLKEREANLAEELKTSQLDATAARQPVEVPALRVYDRILQRQMPVVVPIHGGKCGGCHLKVSGEVESMARGKDPEGKLAICEQCGRIVYWES